MTATYTADSPEVQAFLEIWHENGRASFERGAPSLDYDSEYYAKTAKDRRRFIALDTGHSAAFLLEKTTGIVYSVKAYGVPKRPIATLAELTETYRESTAKSQVRTHYDYIRRGR